MGVDTNLDVILTEVGGFGPYQIINFILICIPTALSATYVVNFMIAANTLDYRCKVAECDIGQNNRDIQYEQPWLHLAIPHSKGKMDNCVRYAPNNTNESNFSDEAHQCSASFFNASSTIKCSEYVYATDERNLQTEFDIHCTDSYKLALVGIISNIGRFVFLPITGLLADRFGRLTMVVSGLMYAGVIGLIKSFSINYVMYLILEFFEAFGTSTFALTFVLAMEWLSKDYRVLGSMLLALSFPLGEVFLGVVAMYIHDFRLLLRVLYTPALFAFVYMWLVPESARWLLVTGRVDRAVDILKKTASGNGKELKSKSIETLNLTYSTESIANIQKKCSNENPSMLQSFGLIIKSKMLVFRLLKCCYLWMTCCFCYYGLSLSAISIPGGNRYTSFISIVIFEIPGILIAIPLLKRMKRRYLMFGLLFVTAISTVVTPFIPEDKSLIILPLFMVGKASITCAINSIYVFTAEQWPTNIRTTIMNSCSMIGRIGSMVAPMTAVLAIHHSSLPAFLFCVTAISGSLIVLLCPETYSKKLPDTMEEAKNL